MSFVTLHHVSAVAAPKPAFNEELSAAAHEMQNTLGAIGLVLAKMPRTTESGARLVSAGLLFEEASIHVQQLAEIMCEAARTLDV